MVFTKELLLPAFLLSGSFVFLSQEGGCCDLARGGICTTDLFNAKRDLAVIQQRSDLERTCVNIMQNKSAVNDFINNALQQTAQADPAQPFYDAAQNDSDLNGLDRAADLLLTNTEPKGSVRWEMMNMYNEAFREVTRCLLRKNAFFSQPAGNSGGYYLSVKDSDLIDLDDDERSALYTKVQTLMPFAVSVSLPESLPVYVHDQTFEHRPIRSFIALGLRGIGHEAFLYTNDLYEIAFPATLWDRTKNKLRVASDAFYESGVYKLIIGDGVRDVDSVNQALDVFASDAAFGYAFRGSGVCKLIIGDGVRDVGSANQALDVFASGVTNNCRITELELPGSLNLDGDFSETMSAFRAPSLEIVVWHDDEREHVIGVSAFDGLGGSANAKCTLTSALSEKDDFHEQFVNKGDSSLMPLSICVPDSVSEIRDRAFAERELTFSSVVPAVRIGWGESCTRGPAISFWPSQLQTIGDRAFYHTNFRDLGYYNAETIPSENAVALLGDKIKAGFIARQHNAFLLPKTLTHIGDSAFEGTNVRIVRLPESVMYLGNGAFDYTNELEEIELHCNVFQPFLRYSAVQCVAFSSMNSWLNLAYANPTTLKLKLKENSIQRNRWSYRPLDRASSQNFSLLQNSEEPESLVGKLNDFVYKSAYTKDAIGTSVTRCIITSFEHVLSTSAEKVSRCSPDFFRPQCRTKSEDLKSKLGEPGRYYNLSFTIDDDVVRELGTDLIDYVNDILSLTTDPAAAMAFDEYYREGEEAGDDEEPGEAEAEEPGEADVEEANEHKMSADVPPALPAPAPALPALPAPRTKEKRCLGLTESLETASFMDADEFEAPQINEKGQTIIDVANVNALFHRVHSSYLDSEWHDEFTTIITDDLSILSVSEDGKIITLENRKGKEDNGKPTHRSLVEDAAYVPRQDGSYLDKDVQVSKLLCAFEAVKAYMIPFTLDLQNTYFRLQDLQKLNPSGNLTWLIFIGDAYSEDPRIILMSNNHFYVLPKNM